MNIVLLFLSEYVICYIYIYIFLKLWLLITFVMCICVLLQDIAHKMLVLFRQGQKCTTNKLSICFFFFLYLSANSLSILNVDLYKAEFFFYFSSVHTGCNGVARDECGVLMVRVLGQCLGWGTRGQSPWKLLGFKENLLL